MKKVLFYALGFLALCVVGFTLWVVQLLSGLPDVSVLKHYRPAASAEVLDKDGNVLTHYYERTFRIWVPISALPDIIVQAVVIAEDDTFFAHAGVNYKATWDALVHDMHKHRFARGGSTITQQMIKNVLLSKEKTLSRKVREYVLARKAEELLTKRKILEIYLNEIEWGDNINGIEAASRYYLGKHASDLNASEAALLAGMIPNPHYFNPYKRLKKARARQERVLFNMQQARVISREEYTAALQAPIRLRQEGSGDGYGAPSGDKNRPCYQNALEQALLTVFDDSVLYRGGRTIRTTLDKGLQEDLNRGEDTVAGGAGRSPDKVLVVKQGGQIRAFVCSTGRERELRDLFESPEHQDRRYEVNIISPSSVSREQIVLSGDPVVK